MATTRDGAIDDLTDIMNNGDAFYDISLRDNSDEESNTQVTDKALYEKFFSKPPSKHTKEIKNSLINSELKFKTDPTNDHDTKNQAVAKTRRYCLII